jgi:hypothetical protein
MFLRFDRLPLLVILLASFSSSVGAQTATAERASPTKKVAKIPTFATVKKVAEATLARDPDYRPGDLLSQRQAGEVLRNVKTAGWDVPKSRELLSRVPSDGEFIVETLRSDEGVSFMRRVAAMPDGYDRIDRLSRIPNGQATVERLINTPGGHELIEYMTTTKGGEALGNSIGHAAGSDEFNRPTGRIYTAKQFLAELERLHKAASKQQ